MDVNKLWNNNHLLGAHYVPGTFLSISEGLTHLSLTATYDLRTYCSCSFTEGFRET